MRILTQCSLLHPPRPLAVLGLLLATAGAAHAQTLTIQGTGSASAPGNDVTAFVDKVEIVRVLDGAVMAGALTNAGFETPGLGGGSFAYRPTGATWTFSGNTGISSSGGGFSPPTIQEGSQTALIQTSPSAIAQPLTLAAGTYQVRFLTAQRTNCCGAPFDQRLTVSVGGTQVGTTTPPTSGFVSYTSNAFTVNGSGAVVTNNALAFDGSNDVVTIPNNAAYTITSAITLETWLRTSVAGERYITTKGDDSWYLAINGGGGPTGAASFFVNGPSGPGGWLYGTSNLADGKWHHVAGTYDGATLRLYVDGVQQNSRAATGAIQTGTSPVSLGARSNGNFWNGSLDEFRLYNTALTAAQVQADMFSANGAAAVPASQVAYFNFDQGMAGGNNAGVTSLPDQSGNGSTGTLTNFALTGTSSNWVRSFPTITGISPTSGKSGTSVTVTGTNLTDATSFAFNGLASASFTTPSSDLTTTITAPVGVMTGPVSVASATLTTYNGPVFTLANDLVVTTTQSIPGDSYTSITVQSGGNGTLAGDVTVSGPIVVNSGGRLADGCNLFTGSGSFTLNAGGSFDICRPRGILSGPNTGIGNLGAVRVLGTRTYSNDASYNYSGNQSQDTGDGLPSQVRNLTVSTASDLALTNSLAVAQVLTLTGNGNLTLGSKALTLLSSAAGTALVVNSGVGVVQGTATVQRYIDASGNTGTSGYRHYAAPVSGMAFSALATTSTGGSFTPIVGSTAYNQAANTSTVTPYPNVYGYDQSRVGSATLATNLTAFDQGYFSPTNATLTVGQGYTVQIGNGEKVNFTGTLNTGTQTIGSLQRGANAASGWQLIGNPYPAPLDWGTVGASGTGSSLNGVDPAAYVFQSTSGYAGRYTSFNNGVGAGSGLLATGQAFFVRASSASAPGTVTLTNANRTTTYAATPAFQRTAETRPLLRLSLAAGSQPITTATAQDETFVYFETGATGDFDGRFDAYKLPNPSGFYLGTAAQVPSGALPTGLSIDGRAPLAAGASLSVPVWLSVAAGTYTLTATELLNFAGMASGTSVALLDALTGTTTNLAAVPSYTFAVTANAPSTGRFTLLFGPATPLATTNPALAQAHVSLYPNPTEGAATLSLAGLPAAARHVQATLSDALGRPVGRVLLALNQGLATAALPTQGLASGIYVLRLDVLNAQSQVLGQLPAQRLSVH